MSTIIKNTTVSDIIIAGVTIPASGQYTMQTSDAIYFASSDKLVTDVGSGDLVVNDGSEDLGPSDGIDRVKGFFSKKTIVKEDPDVVNASNTLRVSQSVAAGTEVADTYVVPNGQTATVKLFEGSAPDSALAVVKLVWDFDGGAEELLWVMQRSATMPKENIVEVTGDGVKKLAIVCDNGCASAYFYNAFAKVEVV
jgi:hypothetical protein